MDFPEERADHWLWLPVVFGLWVFGLFAMGIKFFGVVIASPKTFKTPLFLAWLDWSAAIWA